MTRTTRSWSARSGQGSRTARSAIGLTTALVLVPAAVAATAPVAGAASTALHPAFRPAGPPPGVADVLGLAAGHGTIATVGVARDRTPQIDRTVGAFVVSGPSGIRTGRLPVTGTSPPFNAGYGPPEIAAPGVVLVPTAGLIGGAVPLLRTADGGAHWRSADVPGCPGLGAVGAARAYDASGGGVMTSPGSRGCVWSTTDSGAHWTVVARDQDLDDVVWVGGSSYVAVGPPTGTIATDGAPLRRTDDGGRTWTTIALPPVPAGPDAAPVATAAVGPLAATPDGRVVAGTTSAAILESRDGGRTFARRELARSAKDAAVSATPTSVVLPDGGVHVAAPGRTGILGPTGLAPVPAALRGLTLLATDGGSVVGATQRGRSVVDRIDGSGRRSEIVGGRSGVGVGTGALSAVVRDGVLWSSRDAGRTWTRDRLPPGVRVRAAAADGRATVVLATDGRLWRLAAGGHRALTRAPRHGLRALAVSSGTPVVASSTGLLRLSAGGFVRAHGGPARSPQQLLAADGRALVAVSPTGRVARSGDGGRTWVAGGRVGRYPGAVATSGQTILVTVGRGVRRSTDGGRTFRPSVPLPGLRASGAALAPDRISMRDGRRALVARSGRLLLTTDGGRTFRPVAMPFAAGPVDVTWPRGEGALVQDDLSRDLLRTTALP